MSSLRIEGRTRPRPVLRLVLLASLSSQVWTLNSKRISQRFAPPRETAIDARNLGSSPITVHPQLIPYRRALREVVNQLLDKGRGGTRILTSSFRKHVVCRSACRADADVVCLGLCRNYGPTNPTLGRPDVACDVGRVELGIGHTPTAIRR